MAKLPTDLSGRKVRAALERAGFTFVRRKGSHMILRRSNPATLVVVPDHRQVWHAQGHHCGRRLHGTNSSSC